MLERFSVSPKWRSLILAVTAFFSTTLSVLFYYAVYSSSQNELKSKESPVKSDNKIQAQDLSKSKIYADITGSVQNPGVYEFKRGSRVRDLLESSGGFNAFADKAFFYRNYNLSRVLEDQDKVYIPSISEVEKGIFVESSYYIDENKLFADEGPDVSAGIKGDEDAGTKININKADKVDLEELQGVGPVTAEKIIQYRPYSSFAQLVEKKVISQSLFDKIKNEISL